MSTIQLSENQKVVLSTLVSRGAHFVADVTRSHWERGESYYLDTRCGAANGIRRKFNQGNKEALVAQPH